LKLFILALDGLESTLVEKWQLKGLQQKMHGTLDVSEFKHLLTPIIWASFITGQPPEIHGITSWWSVSTNSRLDKFLHWFTYNVPIIKNMSRQQLRNYGKYFGITVRPPQEADLERKGLNTIFKFAEKPIVIDVPSYNETADTRERYSRAMQDGFSSYENEIWKIHKERVEKIFDRIDGDWDLFMTWIDLVDQLGHIWMEKDNSKMAKGYLDCELLAQKISEQIDDDTTLMIVSDHGMTTVDNIPAHSSHAFYSFNRNVDWKPESILNFADFVKKHLSK
jgi:predicted AlkP superfamily pyrophosphatase or phosphodiesterase